jgi:hypothetical protein
MTPVEITAIIIAVAALAVAVWALLQTQRTKHLRSKFGPEYDHVVDREGNRRRAEAELANRETRVKKLNIRDLAPQDQRRFADSWRREQANFVDNPGAAVSQADVLVMEVMAARGYPTNDFSTQVADLSVDHARVIGNYREAHQIADRSRGGQASTEDLRRAMICYRTLFEELLGSSAVEHHPEEVRR